MKTHWLAIIFIVTITGLISITAGRLAQAHAPITSTVQGKTGAARSLMLTTIPPTSTTLPTPTPTPGPFPALLAEIPLAPAEEQLTGLLLDTEANRLYVTDSAGELHVLEAKTYTELATLHAIGHLTLDASHDRLFASPTEDGGSLTIVDTAALTITGTISPGGAVALDDKRNRLYVGNSGPTEAPLRIYDLTSLAKVGEIAQPGMPVYSPVRDELYLAHLSVHIVDLDRLAVTGKLFSSATETYGWCNGCSVPQTVYVSPDDNVLVVDMRTIAVGKGPGILASPRFFEATTLTELTDLARQPGVEQGCFGQIILAEPVEGRVYRQKIYSRYLAASNLQVYDLAGNLVTWYDGSYLGRTNPRTKQMYRSSQVFTLSPFSPLGLLPAPACIDTIDAQTGRLYGVRENTLVVFSESGGTPPRLPPLQVEAIPDDFLIWDILFSPNYHDDQTVFLDGQQLYRSQDGGQTWVQLRGGLPHAYHDVTLHLTISPDFAQDQILFVRPDFGGMLGGGVYRSTDGGDTWQATWDGLTHLRVHQLSLSPDFTIDNTLLAHAHYQDLAGSGDEALAIYRSNNRGLTWTLVTTQTHRMGQPVPGLWPPASAHFRWVETQVDPGQQVIAIERSTDGSQTWQTVLTLPEDEYFSPQDISITVSHDPVTDQQTVLIAADRYLFRSTDNGDSWQNVLSASSLKEARFSPEFSRDNTVYTFSDERMFRSTDGGQTWQTVLTLPAALYNPLNLTFSPTFTRDNTVYAFNLDTLFRSADNGVNWKPVLTLDRSETNISIQKFLFSPTYETDQTLYLFSNYHLFRSTDQGASWEKVLTLPPSESFTTYREPLFSPDFTTDQTLYLFTDSSLFRSVDKGRTWQKWVDDRLRGYDSPDRLGKLAVSPALDDGRHQLFIRTAKVRETRYGFWVLDPAMMRWETVTAISPTETPSSSPIGSRPTPTATPLAQVPVTTPYAEIWAQLGGETGPLGRALAPAIEGPYAFQAFEHGLMHWGWQEGGTFYIHLLYNGPEDKPQAGAAWERYEDTWQEGQAEYLCPQAGPPFGPRRGFGQVWCSCDECRTRLGSPLEQERGQSGGYQTFAGGVMLWHTADEAIYVLFNEGGWQRFEE